MVKRIPALLILMAVLLLVNGCSGINSSSSVSPASFILPGLIHYHPAQTNLLEPVEVVLLTTVY